VARGAFEAITGVPGSADDESDASDDEGDGQPGAVLSTQQLRKRREFLERDLAAIAVETTNDCAICYSATSSLDALQCDSCGKFHHRGCLRMTQTAFSGIMSDPDVSWTCRACHSAETAVTQSVIAGDRSSAVPAAARSSGGSRNLVLQGATGPAAGLPTSQESTSSRRSAAAAASTVPGAFARTRCKCRKTASGKQLAALRLAGACTRRTCPCLKAGLACGRECECQCCNNDNGRGGNSPLTPDPDARWLAGASAGAGVAKSSITRVDSTLRALSVRSGAIRREIRQVLLENAPLSDRGLPADEQIEALATAHPGVRSLLHFLLVELPLSHHPTDLWENSSADQGGPHLMLSTLPALICLLAYYDRPKIVRAFLWQYWQYLRSSLLRPDALPCRSKEYQTC